MKFDEIKKKIPEIFFDRKFQWGVTVVLFLIILAIGVNIRYQPISTGHLIDSTTGDYTPLALDPYYFLRISETLVENNGVLPAVDNMRYQALNASWSSEILPKSTVFLYNVVRLFDSKATLNFANVVNPVIFFALGLIAFFALAYVLTKNKTVSLTASFILTIIPPYLYRTLAGFSDHEAIGMFGFFLALILFAVGLFYLDRKKCSKLNVGLLGLVAGVATTFAVVGWGGGASFLFMILPLAFLVRWFIKEKKKEIENILFYGLWIVGCLVGALIFNNSVSYIVNGFMLGTTGIFTLVALGFIIIETLINKNIKLLPKKIRAYPKLVSFIALIVFGGILYQIFIGNFFGLIANVLSKIIYPFGTGRVGLTVAENKQPYLTDLISQVGKSIFYIFLVGCFIVGVNISRGIEKKKFRYLFSGSFAFFLFGILFSRISATSVFNGENFASKALFFISFLTVFVSTIYIYSKSKWKIETRWIFIVAWMIPMLLAVRSAVRVFFAIVPFIALIVPMVIYEIFLCSKKYKDEIVKILCLAVVFVAVIAVIVSSVGFYKTVNYQAKGQTPSYNSDWQKAMAWVRDNTTEGSVFLHWWDYGYWIQTGGNRPTVTDGGHFNGYWDHLIARYVLTTPYPETAKSFMKAHNVSYLLIDPTDIGKYTAYSSIGDDNDSSDRYSYIVTLASSVSDIKETGNGTIRIYRGGFMLDDDISFNLNGGNVFLPKGKAGLGAIVLEKQLIDASDSARVTFKQPEGIFVYNGQQYRLPIRKLFISGQLLDYGTGIDSTVYVYPNVFNSNAGQQIDQEGAVMYLSAKVQDSLVAKLYLMNDPDDEYTELELVHEQSAYPFEFSYGGGYNGAIKIYEVDLDEMDDIIAREEFTYPVGDYGELDDLEFVYS